MSEPITFDVLVQPRASRARLGPRHDGRIKIAVTAPPVDGEANAAVIELIAKTLGVAKRDVEVAPQGYLLAWRLAGVSGATSRRKTIRVANATLAQLEAAIA